MLRSGRDGSLAIVVQQTGRTSMTQWLLCKAINVAILVMSFVGTQSGRHVAAKTAGKLIQIWKAISSIEKPILFLSVDVDDIKMGGRKESTAPMWAKPRMRIDLESSTYRSSVRGLHSEGRTHRRRTDQDRSASKNPHPTRMKHPKRKPLTAFRRFHPGVAI